MNHTIFSEERYKIEDRYNDAARKAQQYKNAANDLKKRMDRYEQIYRFFHDKSSGREEIDVRTGKVLTDMRIEAESNERKYKEHQAVLQGNHPGNHPKEAEFIRAVMDNNAKAIERLSEDKDFYLAKYYLACRIVDDSPERAAALFEECKKSREYEGRVNVFVNAIHIYMLQGKVSKTTGKMWSSDYSYSSHSKKEERKKIKNEIYKTKTLLSECEEWSRQEKELRRKLSAIKKNPSSGGQSNGDWIRENEKALDSIRESLESSKQTLAKKVPEAKKKLRAATAGRRIRRAVYLAVVVIALVYGNWDYYSADRDGRSVSWFTPFVPNVITNGNIKIDNMVLPYFISLRPLESLTIPNSLFFSAIINPFGAKELNIYKPMRRLKVHDGTEELYVNCEKLKKLTIPDSVTTLGLMNISDEFASVLILPEHLEHLTIYNSLNLTDKGLQNLEIPESVRDFEISYCDGFKYVESIRLPERLQALKIDQCYGITNMNITSNPTSLYVNEVVANYLTHSVRRELESLTLSGNIEYVEIIGDVPEIEVGCTSKWVDLTSSDNVKLTVNGAVDVMQAGRVEDATFITAPRVLIMEYYGYDASVLPEGIEILGLIDVWSNSKDDRDVKIQNINIPTTVKRLYISGLDSLRSLEVPDGAEYLFLHQSDSLDVENITIPESVLYWDINIGSSEKYSDKYRSEDCPDELADFNIHECGDEYEAIYDKLMGNE